MTESLERAPHPGAAHDERQMVTFCLGDEEFGFDIMAVQEIIRQPVLCRIPTAPAYVDGVANLRGTVLPVVDTRARFGMARRADTDGTRVLVLDVDGHKTGLRVDRVRQVTRVARGEMEPPPAVLRGGASSEFLTGVARLEGGRRIVLSLDARALCRVDVAARDDAAPGPAREARAAAADEGDRSVAQLVSFTLGAEEFAFPMEQVREILRVARPTAVPDAPAHVLGLVTVRGTLLPVIDLRLLLGLRALDAEITARATAAGDRFRAWADAAAALFAGGGGARADAAGLDALRAWQADFATSSQALMETLGRVRVAGEALDRGLRRARGAADGAALFAREVAPLAAEALRLVAEFVERVPASVADDQRLVVVQAGGAPLALLVDRVREVLGVPRALIDPPPRGLSAREAQLSGVARLDDGRRLVMLLDAATLLRGEDLAALEDRGAAAGEDIDMARRSDPTPGGASPDRQYVTFRLDDGEYGIPIEHVREIDRPSKMTRIPHAADHVDGITNLRGEVIPVINARRRFGLPAREVDERARVIILELDGAKTGLLVDSVREVLNQAQRDVAPPPASVSAGVDRQFIAGIAKADQGRRMVVLLDAARVLKD
jgi:chemotaxis signal transduction protein